MGRDYFYKPGSNYILDDRTGFRVRVENSRRQWDGLQVRTQSFENRNAQDFVRGVRDDQTVAIARPRPAYVFDGNAQTTLSASAGYGALFIAVNSPFAFQIGDRIGIALDIDLGVFFLTTISNGDFNSDWGPDFDTFSSSGIPIFPGLPGMASSGNWVVNYSSPQIQGSDYPGSASGAGGGDG